MGLLGRNKEKIIVGTICPKCNMEFSEPGRTLRHIAKAHPKKNEKSNAALVDLKIKLQPVHALLF